MEKEIKVLLVDDDGAFIESNRDLLEAYGYKVFSASSGQAGIAMAVDVIPDIMILDVMMSTDTEGFEVARKVHEIPALEDMKILLVTGVSKELTLPAGLVADAVWLPVDRILEKPIRPDRLLSEIKKILGR